MSTTDTTTFSAETYAAASTGDKARMRTAISDAISAAVLSGDMDRATELVGIQQSFGPATKPTVEVDWTQRVVDLHATLKAALQNIENGVLNMPEGVAVPDLSEVVWEGGTVDEKLAAKLATVSGRKAGRGSVVAWIESVVTDEPAKISDLRARWTPTSDYPKAPPSAGAIGAAFDRVEAGAEADFTVTTVDGKRGAVA